MTSRPNAQFTQSWTWGEFRISRHQRIRRLALTDVKGNWLAAGMFMLIEKPIVGGYWYAPRGPVVAATEPDLEKGYLKKFFDELKASGLFKHVLFWRAEPPVETDAPATLVPKGFVRSHAYQPVHTLLVNLDLDEKTLLGGMHEKTRYNIRLAERKGVTVRVASEETAIDTFLRLNDQTASRDAFTSQPSAYIRETYEFLHNAGMAQIRFAEFEGDVLAASIEIAYGDTVTYLYGASSNEKRNMMAPHALHWSAIRSAKAQGYRVYDFHGVNPVDEHDRDYKSSWKGITRFKLGWGGRRVNYAGTWELPRHPMFYRIFRMVSG